MFSRMRSWVDVAPWVRLGRLPRILASPGYVGLCIAACLLTLAVANITVPISLSRLSIIRVDESAAYLIHQVSSTGIIAALTFAVLIWMIWTPVLQVVGRAGASLVAGRGLPSLGASIRLTGGRLGRSYLAAVVPLLCVAGMGLILFILSLPAVLTEWTWLATLSGWAIGLGAIPAGILAFGALFAIPFALVAICCEPDPDVFDSLSRGYEYLYRRPLHLVWYVLVSAAMVYVATWFFQGVAASASTVAGIVAGAVDQTEPLLSAAFGMIGLVFVAWQVTLSLALIGGMYLLLRRDAGGQELDDFWIPPTKPSASLPKLPDEADQS